MLSAQVVPRGPLALDGGAPSDRVGALPVMSAVLVRETRFIRCEAGDRLTHTDHTQTFAP
ncbi:hypothetical protein GCM10007079_21180 [Nocardiopsis terrae]|nr:hypothetical protein GCM10007079_21180 [Nocardiopsis terrae]